MIDLRLDFVVKDYPARSKSIEDTDIDNISSILSCDEFTVIERGGIERGKS